MSIDKTVIAILLGDGHVSKRGRICFHHGIEQKEYLHHKVNILSRYGFKFRIYETERTSYGKLRKFIKADGYASQESKMLRKMMYPHGKKIVPLQYAMNFDFYDWSFIYMDDGRANKISHVNNLINGVRTRISTPPWTNKYEFSVESFDEKDKLVLQDNLLTHGVESSISKRGRILITKAKSKAIFYDEIKEFIIPSMNYKISPLPCLSYNSQ